MRGSDYALRVGWGVVVEPIEVRRHKSVGVWHEVGVPKTSPQIRNLPPRFFHLEKSPVSSRGRSVPTFPFSPTRPISLFTHSLENIV